MAFLKGVDVAITCPIVVPLLKKFIDYVLRVFENHRKCLIQHSKRIQNTRNGQFFRFFENLEVDVNQCYRFKCDTLINFQTTYVTWMKI